MKKLFLVMSLVLMLTVGNIKAEAGEVSFGFSGIGLGFNVLRGDNAEAVKDRAYRQDIDKIATSLMPMFQLDLMIEFVPFLALETGIGYGLSFVSYTSGLEGLFEDGTEFYVKSGFTIPIMLRLQHEGERALIYFSVGPKFIIPVLGDYAFRTISFSAFTDGITILKNNDFGLDVGFALGGEIRLGDANYLGIRVAYDLNVISVVEAPYRISDDDFEFYHDNFGVSLTYRYAFGSKWKK